MRSGELDRRVNLQAPTTTRGAAGSVIKSFATDSTVWASITDISGKEFLSIQQTQNETKVRIVIRHHSTIKDTWRVVDTGPSPNDIYTIHFIDRGKKRKVMLTLMCSSGVQTQ